MISLEVELFWIRLNFGASSRHLRHRSDKKHFVFVVSCKEWLDYFFNSLHVCFDAVLVNELLSGIILAQINQNRIWRDYWVVHMLPVLVVQVAFLAWNGSSPARAIGKYLCAIMKLLIQLLTQEVTHVLRRLPLVKSVESALQHTIADDEHAKLSVIFRWRLAVCAPAMTNPGKILVALPLSEFFAGMVRLANVTKFSRNICGANAKYC